MLAEDRHWRITGIAIENCEAEWVEEITIS
jgi:hypothetical protein